MMTLAPSRARARAMAKPIPRFPPVTSATWSSRLRSCGVPRCGDLPATVLRVGLGMGYPMPCEDNRFSDGWRLKLRLEAVRLIVADQRKELFPRLRCSESSQHRRGDGRGMLLLDAAHHHAQVPCFD